MTTPSSHSGWDVETAQPVELASSTEVLRFNNRVCVVITDESNAADSVRRWLGDSLPLRVTSWRRHAYQEVIRRLRPRVVVVLGSNPNLTWDSGSLVACLFARFEPTVISASIATGAESDPKLLPRLLIHRLGSRAQVELASLAELILLD